MLSEKDIADLLLLGIDPEKVKDQIEFFRNGQSYQTIVAPASVGNGINVPDGNEQEELLKIYENFRGTTVKFVPASGAATRMFRDLFELLETFGTEQYNSNTALKFFGNLQKFAFYNILSEAAARFGITDANERDLLELVLKERGLNYGAMPKGLVMFHRYGDHSSTAFEEHLTEGAHYLKRFDYHFTVSENHLDAFLSLFEEVRPRFEARFGVTPHIGFSFQEKSTDTIAVYPDLSPVRKADGTLLFRPGGHGALLENLGQMDENIIFVKNIDNVIKESALEKNIRWKKILAGKMLEIRNKIFGYLEALDGERREGLYEEITGFFKNELYITLPDVPDEIRGEFLRAKLDRPVRVCGMIRNAGEPGGGPFLVRDDDGSTSLQILEQAQIDPDNTLYMDFFRHGTHFNPVDIVCSIKRYDGAKFDLARFTNPGTAFISEKSIEGKKIMALELPGLWNGAMSNWNTLFVEVPPYTFTPVKTVFDLLRDEHQN
jgi:hypothetical protein